MLYIGIGAGLLAFTITFIFWVVAMSRALRRAEAHIAGEADIGTAFGELGSAGRPHDQPGAIVTGRPMPERTNATDAAQAPGEASQATVQMTNVAIRIAPDEGYEAAQRIEFPGIYAKTNCVVCLDNSSTHAFVPCGHQAVCLQCAMRQRWFTCPVCRANAKMVMHVYVVGISKVEKPPAEVGALPAENGPPPSRPPLAQSPSRPMGSEPSTSQRHAASSGVDPPLSSACAPGCASASEPNDGASAARPAAAAAALTAAALPAAAQLAADGSSPTISPSSKETKARGAHAIATAAHTADLGTSSSTESSSSNSSHDGDLTQAHADSHAHVDSHAHADSHAQPAPTATAPTQCDSPDQTQSQNGSHHHAGGDPS